MSLLRKQRPTLYSVFVMYVMVMLEVPTVCALQASPLYLTKSRCTCLLTDFILCSVLAYCTNSLSITHTHTHTHRSRAKAAIGFSYSDEGAESSFLEPEDEKERAFSSESEYGQSTCTCTVVIALLIKFCQSVLLWCTHFLT